MAPVPHPFNDPGLLAEALTHASWSHEHGGKDNERLEFLGDAVLQLCVTRALVGAFPQAGEGELSRMRQQVVSTRALASVARELQLGTDLRLGVGEEATGGRDRDRNLAGAVEAMIGAVFLDGGFDAAASLVELWTRSTVAGLSERPDGGKDARSLLQERVQARGSAAPSYVVVERTGPAHEPTFVVEVRVGDATLGSGTGSTKREAARRAAEAALGPAPQSVPAPTTAPTDGSA